MDPNATWVAMREALEARDYPTAAEHAENLFNWLDKSGFPPDAVCKYGDDIKLQRLNAATAESVCLLVLGLHDPWKSL